MTKKSILCVRRGLNLLLAVSMLLGFVPLSVTAASQPAATSRASATEPGAAAADGVDIPGNDDWTDQLHVLAPQTGGQLPVSFSYLTEQDVQLAASDLAAELRNAPVDAGAIESDDLNEPFLSSMVPVSDRLELPDTPPMLDSSSE
jgi:hypothetical protein